MQELKGRSEHFSIEPASRSKETYTAIIAQFFFLYSDLCFTSTMVDHGQP